MKCFFKVVVADLCILHIVCIPNGPISLCLVYSRDHHTEAATQRDATAPTLIIKYYWDTGMMINKQIMHAVLYLANENVNEYITHNTVII